MRCTPAMDSSRRMPLPPHHRGGACSEAASPGTRERITQAAVWLADSAEQHSREDTVAFLMNEDEYFYFIEMNALSVDPVKEQLKVAGARGHR